MDSILRPENIDIFGRAEGAHPLLSTKDYSPKDWPIEATLPLPIDIDEPNSRFVDALKFRRTRRDFAPLDYKSLGVLLSLTIRVQQIGNSDLGFPLTRRPPPSAGAIHPIHLLLANPHSKKWVRYDPFQHALIELITNIDPGEVRLKMEEVLSAPDATLLMFVAEPAMSAAKYGNPCSLVWRDAGILQGYMALGAEALGLNFCLLGVTGEPWVGQLFEQKFLVGVGVAFLGARC